MTVRQLAILSGLVVVLALLGFALGAYAQQQRFLDLESNRLLSRDAFQVREDAEGVIDAVKRAGADAWVLGAADGYDGAWAIAAKEISRVPLPLRGGPGFSGEDGQEAVVGSEVETRTEGDVRTVRVFDRTYEVVGDLGLREDSALADLVVVHDMSIIRDAGVETVTVDGPDGRATILDRFGEAVIEDIPAGSLHRTNIDYVSPQILGFGGALTVVGWATAGILASRLSLPAMRVRHLRGVRWRRLSAKQGGIMAGLSLAASTVVFGAGMATGHALPGMHVLATTAISVATVTSATLLMTSGTSRSRHA